MHSLLIYSYFISVTQRTGNVNLDAVSELQSSVDHNRSEYRDDGVFNVEIMEPTRW